MLIDDYIEKIALQETVKSLTERLKNVEAENLALKDQNTVLKNTLIQRKNEIDILKYSNSVLKKNAAECKLMLNKVYGAESCKDGEGFGDGEINCSDEDFLKCQLSNREGKIEALKAKIKMLESDHKDSLKFQDRIKGLESEVKRLKEEKQQGGDNLRNRIKDLESEIDELKKNQSTDSIISQWVSAASDVNWPVIHTADVETINKLNIKVHDLNNTITTLLDRLSKSTDENQELKKKVHELKDIIKDLGAKLYK